MTVGDKFMSAQLDGDLALLELIRKTPNVLGGDARIGERRLAVWMVVRARQLGLTDEQIRAWVPAAAQRNRACRRLAIL